jgi:catechol 2,3-dioxygenase-like lactoylglutathione lyase family enzyme
MAWNLGLQKVSLKRGIPLEAQLWLRRFLRLPFGLRTCGHPFASTKMSWEIIYGSEGSYFTSLRTKDGDTILNLEHGNASMRWGRVIFHVSDVDRSWAYLMEKGFHPDSPQDASWGERYFHLPDPDGHELSFARPI